METWLIVTISLLVGAAIGAIAARFLLPRADQRLADRKARQEMEEYRNQVADHFARTATLVNQMTDSYKEVFDHLQQGAYGLLDDEQLRTKLAVKSGQTVTLDRLGYRRSEDDRHHPQVPPDPGWHDSSDDER